jgi:hypothetical protein
MNLNFDKTMRNIQHAVTDAGGEWIGVQSALGTGGLDMLPQIVFRHPRTRKTILLSFNPMNLDTNEISEHVFRLIQGESSAVKEPCVSITLAALQQISKNLEELQAELTALIERTKS